MDIKYEKQNKMFAKNDLNSVALNMSTVRPQLNSYDYGLDWHWDFQELTRTTEKIIHYIWEDACYIFICLFFLNYYIYMLIFDIWKWLGEVKKLVVFIADFYSTMYIKGTSY